MTQTTEAPKPQRSRGHLCPVYITLARPMRRSKGEKSPADPLAPITAPAMLRSCNCHRPATGAATALEPGSGAHHAALPCRRSPLPVPGTAPLKPVPALALLCRRCCEVAAVKSSLLCRRSPPMPPPPCPRHRGGCWCRPPRPPRTPTPPPPLRPSPPHCSRRRGHGRRDGCAARPLHAAHAARLRRGSY
jgi:hypothetical protein